MKNTVAEFGDMVLIGFTASLWLTLLLFRTSTLTIAQLREFGEFAGSWATLIALAASLVFYQVGYLVNSFCHFIMMYTLNRRPRDPMYRHIDGGYERVRACVQALAPPQSRQGIATERSMIRQARANTMNFLITAIVLFTWGGRAVVPAVIALAVCAAFLAQTVFAFRRYHRRVLNAYGLLVAVGPQPEASAGRQADVAPKMEE